MKKSQKIMLRILPIVFVLAIMITGNIFASATSPIGVDLTTGTNGVSTLDTTAKKIWNSVALILQILAIAAVVFAGVRYMFSSADAKADIKKSMGILAVGAILVFGATTVIQFITKLAGDVVGNVNP